MDYLLDQPRESRERGVNLAVLGMRLRRNEWTLQAVSAKAVEYRQHLGTGLLPTIRSRVSVTL